LNGMRPEASQFSVVQRLAVELSQQDLGFVGEGMSPVDVAGVQGFLCLRQELPNMLGCLLLGVAELAGDPIDAIFNCSDGV